MAKTDLATIPENNYLAVLRDPDLAIAIQDNVGGQITPFMLPRIKVPTGGAPIWMIPDVDGEIQGERTLNGIIVHAPTWRSYWSADFGTGGNLPPDCQSQDGYIGVGDPGGECAKCPMNEWKSDSRGRGKACKEMKALFILREGDVFPSLLLAPPTSLKDLGGYFINLANKRRSYWKVETALSLRQEKNADGVDYCVIAPRSSRVLNDEEVQEIASYRERVRPILETQQISRDDYEVES